MGSPENEGGRQRGQGWGREERRNRREAQGEEKRRQRARKEARLGTRTSGRNQDRRHEESSETVLVKDAIDILIEYLLHCF